MAEELTEKRIFCPRCGNQVMAGAAKRFCSSCGLRLWASLDNPWERDARRPGEPQPP